MTRLTTWLSLVFLSVAFAVVIIIVTRTDRTIMLHVFSIKNACIASSAQILYIKKGILVLRMNVLRRLSFMRYRKKLKTIVASAM